MYSAFQWSQVPDGWGFQPAQVERLLPDLVILDVMMPELDGYAVCRRLRANPKTARLPILMLTSQDTLEEKLHGFESGADEYMIKPFEPRELQIRVQVLLRNAAVLGHPSSAAAVESKTIAVFSLRGGVGVSTTAANLAIGLSQLWGTSAVLVDLAVTAGHSALLLNLSPRTTWGNLTERAIEDLDADVLERVLLTHGSGARVLAAPRRAEQGERLTADKVNKVLELLKQRYPYIVLDLPHDFHELTLTGLDQADEILLLLAPELAALMNASTALETFESLGYPKAKIRLGLNYLSERQHLPLSAMETALKRPIAVAIPFMPDPIMAAINTGQPPVYTKPTGEVGALFEDLAYCLSQEAQREQPPTTPTPAWTRVAHRLEQRKKK